MNSETDYRREQMKKLLPKAMDIRNGFVPSNLNQLEEGNSPLKQEAMDFADNIMSISARLQ
ncbi:MAG: hypothetical protein WC657_08445, partial [Candidatus Paceibacterota bacterium]|jgi:hypothetical protein